MSAGPRVRVRSARVAEYPTVGSMLDDRRPLHEGGAEAEVKPPGRGPRGGWAHAGGRRADGAAAGVPGRRHAPAVGLDEPADAAGSPADGAERGAQLARDFHDTEVDVGRDPPQELWAWTAQVTPADATASAAPDTEGENGTPGGPIEASQGSTVA
ncbi:hypothetical protein GCM10010343_17560 [Streptomyces avidinii]|nr:hypothetical protein GCM10010343_17560 [Streptomyces avidinii]